jgi:sugar transferase (PEP-CTERM system associated)
MAGLYRLGARHAGVLPLVRRACLAALIGGALAGLALLADGAGTQAMLPLWRAVLYVALGAVLVRSVSHALHSHALGALRVLIVGTGTEAAQVARDLRRSPHPARLVGFYPVHADTPPSADAAGPAPVFARTADLVQLAQQHRVHDIVVAVREQRGGTLPMAALLACRIRGMRVLSLADHYEHTHGEVPIDGLQASWLVFRHGFAQGWVRHAGKRCFDLLFASLLLLAAAPVMLATALAIRLQGPGPVIYRQQRVGLGGRLFTCRKFRSMRIDAEADGVARWAVHNDDRVTPVGAFLRRTRIDELPQLLSVLCGDMSLVGPRPERPSFVAELRQSIPFYDIRHSVKPGVTGWAQVRYGYCATLDDARRKHQFDLYYVKNHSLLLDLLVLVETVSVVLLREGAQ